jgi:hypothetical protein
MLPGRGRSAASPAARPAGVCPVNRVRMPSGPVMISALAWLIVWVRWARAVRLATIGAPIASTWPSRPRGAPDARPDRAARAALTASSGPGLAPAAAVLPAGPVHPGRPRSRPRRCAGPVPRRSRRCPRCRPGRPCSSPAASPVTAHIQPVWRGTPTPPAGRRCHPARRRHGSPRGYPLRRSRQRSLPRTWSSLSWLRDGTHPLAADLVNPGPLPRPGQIGNGTAGRCHKTRDPGQQAEPKDNQRRHPISRPGRDPGHRPYAHTTPTSGSRARSTHPHPPCRVCVLGAQSSCSGVWRADSSVLGDLRPSGVGSNGSERAGPGLTVSRPAGSL